MRVGAEEHKCLGALEQVVELLQEKRLADEFGCSRPCHGRQLALVDVLQPVYKSR